MSNTYPRVFPDSRALMLLAGLVLALESISWMGGRVENERGAR